MVESKKAGAGGRRGGMMDSLITKPNSFVPPQPGTPIPYVCMECGENFTKKKSYIRRTIKCPKCGSIKVFSPVRW